MWRLLYADLSSIYESEIRVNYYSNLARLQWKLKDCQKYFNTGFFLFS